MQGMLVSDTWCALPRLHLESRYHLVAFALIRRPCYYELPCLLRMHRRDMRICRSTWLVGFALLFEGFLLDDESCYILVFIPFGDTFFDVYQDQVDIQADSPLWNVEESLK